ncbi:hypothetical protein E1292_17600 [Nonomuraea deserti]|uniref:HTH marR-type domain-containing protein n=1 Tax=Nonomuraea deserti TaxID=1848322 RepID=A0A4R4VHX3_9ACTN|nr:hypothetical protein [Nonomuraea deserti]TDD05269.1 hypothetical protein E1292_17600 [Nonomuraea deserti]
MNDLESRGALALQPRPGHGRILDAQLTDKGRQLLAEADLLTEAIEDRMTTGLDEQQRQQLLHLLQHCTTALDPPPEAQQGHPGPETPQKGATHH